MTATIWTAFLEAQHDLKTLAKSADNPFFKSQYTPFEEIWAEAVRVLHPRAFMLRQDAEVLSAEHGCFQVLTMLTYTPTGEHIVGRFPMWVGKHDPQGAGSAMTYGKRYGLAALLGIMTGDPDDDGNAASKQLVTASQSSRSPKPETRPPQALQKVTQDVAESIAKAYGRGPIPALPGVTAAKSKDGKAWFGGMAGEPITMVPEGNLEAALNYFTKKAAEGGKWGDQAARDLDVVRAEVERRAGRFTRVNTPVAPLEDPDDSIPF